MLKQHRPDLANGKSDSELIALKTNPDLSKQMIDAYAADNGQILAKNGLPVTQGSSYLAHFAGPQGAVSVLKADPNAPVSQILGPEVVKANPFLANMSAADLRAWADKKMGGTPSSGAPAAPQTPAGSGILNQVPQGTAAPGVLNAPEEDNSALTAFRNQLANLAAAHQSAPLPALQPIPMAMPRGIPRARLLAALNQPLS